MLYPQSNAFRQWTDLSGFWDFRFDPENGGESAEWYAGFPDGRPIAVPASWNDQFEDTRDNMGPAWYQTRFGLPWGWGDQQVRVRFGSVNYRAKVWLNGELLGEHEGGHLPFEFDVSAEIRKDDNLLVVQVDGKLAHNTVPPGNLQTTDMLSPIIPYPSTSFDFFPYCGIHRPVLLCALPHGALDDLTVTADIRGSTGLVHVRLGSAEGRDATLNLSLSGHGSVLNQQVSGGGGILEVKTAELYMYMSSFL